MERKILIAMVLLAAGSLLWVFEFMDRENNGETFAQKTNLDIKSDECIEFDKSDILPILDPTKSVHQRSVTSYVLRPGYDSPKSVEKLLVTIEQPVCDLTSLKSCEQKRMHQLQQADATTVSIESLQVQLTSNWPQEYEVLYKRMSGDWTDLEAHFREMERDGQVFIKTSWQGEEREPRTPPSI